MESVIFEKFTLANGLDVIVQEDRSLPIVAVNVWYHVGSKDEEPGRTGFAHLFEHVMFEGSKNHNHSYFEPLQKVGAVLNGSTTCDRTNYWENVPSNYLDLALWLQSDRMGFLLDALDQRRFDVQRDVVKNERRQSYENRPYGMAYLRLQPAVFPSPHPYNWPVIGSQEDLDAATLDDVKGFFRRFYAPSNASLAIVGDVSAAEAHSKVERFFGDLPPAPVVPRLGSMPSSLKGCVSVDMEDKVQLPRLYLVWPTGPISDPDQHPLDMLGAVLGDGKSSRLYRSLVYDKQIARDVSVSHQTQEIASEFHIQVTANPGHDLQEIESAVMSELDRIRREPPDEHELERTRNWIESYHARRIERFGGFGGRADLLNYYNVYKGDPNGINTDLKRYMSVTADDVQRVASSAIGDHYVRLAVTPEKGLTSSSGAMDRSVMPPAGPEPAFAPPVPSRTRLANGMSLVHLGRPEAGLVAIGLLVRAGALTDPTGVPGLADMVVTMLAEGTAKRTSSQISEDMEFLGAHLNAEGSREHALLSTEVLASKWTDALEIIADVATGSVFPDKELERIRRDRLTDLRRISDNPNTIAGRAYRALLYGPESRYGHPLTGTEASVEGMRQPELLAHFGGHFQPQAATLMVVGDVTQDEAAAGAEKFFSDWKGGNAGSNSNSNDSIPALQKSTIYIADKPSAAQSIVRAGHLTIPRSDDDYFALSLVNYIFGGQFSARLNTNLRQDKGYSYGYMSSINWATGPSSLQATGGVQTAVTKEAVIETLKEFADIRGGRPVTADEFADARDGILRGLPASFETLRQTLQQLTRMVAFDLPLDYFAKFPGNLLGVSLEDVRRVATERLDDAHLTVLVVGDREVIEPGLREVGLPIVHVDHEGKASE